MNSADARRAEAKPMNIMKTKSVAKIPAKGQMQGVGCGDGLGEYIDPRGLIAWHKGLPKKGMTRENISIAQESRCASLDWPLKEAPCECPFCGSKAVIIEIEEERVDEEEDRAQHWSGYVCYRACCLECGATGPDGGHDSASDAAVAWNSTSSPNNVHDPRGGKAL